MKLVLLRHGESIWNKENRFTGWVDVDLSTKGIDDAKKAGKMLKKEKIVFQKAYTSVLKRAINTLELVKKEMNTEIPTYYSWKLNERHYGALQGLNKDEMRKKYGEEQVHIWRRSYDVRPPELSKEEAFEIKKDPKYKDLKDSEILLCESLKDTLERTVNYFLNEIEPNILKGENIIIVAHGNSLRSIRKYLENISDEEIVNVEMPIGIPYIYDIDKDFNIKNKCFINDKNDI